MIRGVLRAAAVLVLLLFTAASSVSAQGRRWFTEFGFGQAATLDRADAWNGKGSTHVAFGLAFERDLSANVALSLDNLGYDIERLAQLFPTDSIIQSRVSGQVVGVTAGLEWAYPWLDYLRPSVGVGLSYLNRKLLGFPTDRYWNRCIFDEEPAYEAGCSEFMRDIRIRGSGMGLASSAGVDFVLRGQEIGFLLRVAKTLAGDSSGVLSGRIRYRWYFF